jgi:hypothetical protein
MNILDPEKMIVETEEQSMTEVDGEQFDEAWENAMPGDEFWSLVREHIDEWYDAKKLL